MEKTACRADEIQLQNTAKFIQQELEEQRRKENELKQEGKIQTVCTEKMDNGFLENELNPGNNNTTDLTMRELPSNPILRLGEADKLLINLEGADPRVQINIAMSDDNPQRLEISFQPKNTERNMVRIPDALQQLPAVNGRTVASKDTVDSNRLPAGSSSTLPKSSPKTVTSTITKTTTTTLKSQPRSLKKSASTDLPGEFQNLKFDISSIMGSPDPEVSVVASPVNVIDKSNKVNSNKSPQGSNIKREQQLKERRNSGGNISSKSPMQRRDSSGSGRSTPSSGRGSPQKTPNSSLPVSPAMPKKVNEKPTTAVWTKNGVPIPPKTPTNVVKPLPQVKTNKPQPIRKISPMKTQMFNGNGAKVNGDSAGYVNGSKPPVYRSSITIKPSIPKVEDNVINVVSLNNSVENGNKVTVSTSKTSVTVPDTSTVSATTSGSSVNEMDKSIVNGNVSEKSEIFNGASQIVETAPTKPTIPAKKNSTSVNNGIPETPKPIVNQNELRNEEVNSVVNQITKSPVTDSVTETPKPLINGNESTKLEGTNVEHQTEQLPNIPAPPKIPVSTPPPPKITQSPPPQKTPTIVETCIVETIAPPPSVSAPVPPTPPMANSPVLTPPPPPPMSNGGPPPPPPPPPPPNGVISGSKPLKITKSNNQENGSCSGSGPKPVVPDVSRNMMEELQKKLARRANNC